MLVLPRNWLDCWAAATTAVTVDTISKPSTMDVDFRIFIDLLLNGFFLGRGDDSYEFDQLPPGFKMTDASGGHVLHASCARRFVRTGCLMEVHDESPVR